VFFIYPERPERPERLRRIYNAVKVQVEIQQSRSGYYIDVKIKTAISLEITIHPESLVGL